LCATFEDGDINDPEKIHGSDDKLVKLIMTQIGTNESNHALRTLLTLKWHTIDDDTEDDVRFAGTKALRAWRSHKKMQQVFDDLATSKEKGCGLIFLRGRDNDIAHMLCWIKLKGNPLIIDPTLPSVDERIFSSESIESFEKYYGDVLGCEVSPIFVVWCAGGPQSMHVPTTSPMRILYDDAVEVKSEAAQ
jgi:hypothetical protein